MRCREGDIWILVAVEADQSVTLGARRIQSGYVVLAAVKVSGKAIDTRKAAGLGYNL